MKLSRFYLFHTFLLIIILSCFVTAQGFADLSTDIKNFKSQFAVPDAPAFNVLGVNPTKIMKPGSVMDLALGAADFIGENESITLPQSFALEFSPGFAFAGKNLTLQEYQSSAFTRLLYRTRISLATRREDGESTASDLAIGLRITVDDESDFRNNPEYIDSVNSVTMKILKIITDKKKSLKHDRDSLITLKDKIQPKIDSLLSEGIVPARDIEIPKEYSVDEIKQMPDVAEEINNLMEKFNTMWSQEKWAEENWNSDITEFALALKTTSPDSLVKDLMFSKLAFWYSSAYKLGNWGQFLFGSYGSYEKDPVLNKYITSASIGLRIYAGTNKMKFYLETQGSVIEEKNPEWLLNSGLEIKIQNNIWAEFTTGLKTGNEAQDGSLVTDFKLKYGI